MATPSDGRGSEPQLLHPASLIFSVLSAARRLLLPGLVVLFAARGSDLEFWLMLLFFPAVVAAFVRYWSFRYRLGTEELVIREGLITRNERHVPYHRIQNIDLVQNPLHRLLRVAEVRIETAGGDKPEAVIRVLSEDAVARMRSSVFSDRGTGEAGARAAEQPSEAPARCLHHLPPKEVALFGIISNQGMLVVAAAIGVLWQLDVMDRITSKINLSEESLKRLPSSLPATNPLLVALALVAAIVGFVVLLRVLSVTWAFLKLHDFRLTLRGEDLRAEYGLLTRVTKTIPRQRIQLVSVRESFLHRLFSRAAVQIETAGGVAEEAESTADRLWLAPLIAKPDVPALFREALPGVDLGTVRWQPVSPRTRRRLLRRSLVLVALAAAAAGLGLRSWAAISVLALVPLAWVHAKLYVRHAGWAIQGGAVLYRSGWWDRRLSAARFAKIQAVELVASPFDRRNDMATLRVDTAGAGRVGHRLALAFLEAATAAGLRQRLAHEAARMQFRW